MEGCRLDVDEFSHATNNASLDGGVVHRPEVACYLFRSDSHALSHVVVW